MTENTSFSGTSFSGTCHVVLGYFLTFGKVPLTKDSVIDRKGVSYSLLSFSAFIVLY